MWFLLFYVNLCFYFLVDLEGKDIKKLRRVFLELNFIFGLIFVLLG